MSKERREMKYQWLKLHHSGRTLSEIKALTKGASVGLSDEYAPKKGRQNLESVYGFIERVRMTRGQAADLSAKKMLRPTKNYPKNREEALATWITGHTKRTVNWRRDGNLIRKGKPNKPRIGSSKGKIGKTIIRGDDVLIKELTFMLNSLARLDPKNRKGMMKQVRGVAKSIRTQATSK